MPGVPSLFQGHREPAGSDTLKLENPEARAPLLWGPTLWTRSELRASSPQEERIHARREEHRSRGDRYPRGPGQFGGLSVLALLLEKNLFRLVVPFPGYLYQHRAVTVTLSEATGACHPPTVISDPSTNAPQT